MTMASSNSLSNHLEDLRSRNPQSPPTENVYTGYSTPSRYSGSFLNPNPHQSDTRSSSTRRMTADSNLFNAFTSMTQQPSGAWDSVDMNASVRDPQLAALGLADSRHEQTLYKVQALEKKRMELEKTREQRRRFDAELEKFNRQQAQEERELQQMANDLQGLNMTSGHQSEPTTPPEYRDTTIPPRYNRRSARYSSSSSVVSPPTSNSRLSRSGSQMTPPTDSSQGQQSGSESDQLPSKSVPGSRRTSSDRFSAYLADLNAPAPPRTTPRNNRYSMPVQRTKRESVPEFGPTSSGLGHLNTASFLFEDDDEAEKDSTAAPNIQTYLHMNTTDDKFPILIRNNTQPDVLSASSTALDLAAAQANAQETIVGWPSAFPSRRNRLSQNSLPQNFFDPPRSSSDMTPPSSSSAQSYNHHVESPSGPGPRKSNRHSMDPSLAALARNSMYAQTQSAAAGPGRPGLANFPSSYSTNDLPTLKNNDSGAATSRVSPPTGQSNQQFHNHNASLGRIPPGVANNRLSRENSALESHREETTPTLKSATLEPPLTSTGGGAGMPALTSADQSASLFSQTGPQQFPTGNYYGTYGMQLMNMGLSAPQMPVGSSGAFSNQISMYQGQQTPFGGFANYAQTARAPDSQARVIQQRRMQNAEEIARFTNAKIENYRGEIYSLCKDQHGCRYLQKQLETRNPETVHLIFLETQTHVVELMTDPFGNYLCQKLLEHSNDAQRTVLVDNAAPEMVKIALNQHGTRALQKMIEFISTPGQTQTIIHALKDKVVELIQDLNGNHVIQKCLNRLSAEDSQFIFDAVGAHCVVVGTHRHGCCVLQRCIDHASAPQKAALIAQITANSYSLVQDPFGNYVLQYIVDLNEPQFTEPLCYTFKASIPALSKQKFSSNVIEKCLRHADTSVSRVLVEEMLNPPELEKMLRDSYANYVVQTALDFSDRDTRTRLVEVIRPILPSIRGTPYGRRIQSKIMSQASDAPTHIAAAMDTGAAPAGRGAGAGPPISQFNPQNNRGGYNAMANGFTHTANQEHKTFVPHAAGAGGPPPHLSGGRGFPGGFGGPNPPPPQQYNRMPPPNGFGGYF